MVIKKKQYNFTEQKRLGKAGEDFLDSFFSRWYSIAKVPLAIDRTGIDRYFCAKNSGSSGSSTKSVEYKTDYKKTGCAFIEISQSQSFADGAYAINSFDGWLNHTSADFLIYYAKNSGLIFVIPMEVLRRAARKQWIRQYPILTCQNRWGGRDYQSSGLVVPFAELERICVAFFKV